MAANRVGRRVNKVCGNQSPGRSLQRRQARVTVKYNRQELQRRLDTEKWIDCGLDQLYQNQELEMPDEVNIDELLDLKTDEERTHRLKEILCSCNNSTESFISELLTKLQGLQKQEDLHNDGTYPARSGSASRGRFPSDHGAGACHLGLLRHSPQSAGQWPDSSMT